MTIRILLADDHRIVREGLRALLQGQPDMAVVAEAENGRSAVQLVRDLRPDIVIMDVTMPDLNGIEATRKIVETHPEARIIGLSIHSDRRFVLQMFRAGSSAYLLKDCAFDELVRAIRAVADSQIYLSPSIAGIMVGELLRDPPGSGPESASPSLTHREREVLQLMAEGRTTKEIAFRLQVSAKTVESHRRHIMAKLQMNSVAELTKYAIREGLTAL